MKYFSKINNLNYIPRRYRYLGGLILLLDALLTPIAVTFGYMPDGYVLYAQFLLKKMMEIYAERNPKRGE